MAKMSELTAGRLLAAIRLVASRPEECARDPGRDFTRDRKLGLGKLLLLLVTWAQDTADAELADLFGWDGEAPGGPAPAQAWGKLRDDAVPRLCRAFLSMFGPVPCLGRRRLLAADGTEPRLLPGTGGDSCRVRNAVGGGSHWEAHLTCAYDLARRTFEDMVAQGGAEEDEPGAPCALAGRSGPPGGLTDLWLADRGFCSWNAVAHMQAAGASFCLRARDPWVGQLLGDELREGEFDLTVGRTLLAPGRGGPGGREARRPRRLDVDVPEGGLRVRVRVVRLRLPARDGDPQAGDRWPDLVTDLPEDEFPPAALAAPCSLRWGEEVSFPRLKHTVGLRDPRTRDLGRAVQEAWGNLVLYNACSLGSSGVPAPARGRKHARATDRGHAFKSFQRMLRDRVRRRAFDVEACAARHSHSVRPGRGHARRKRPKSPPRSQYRH